MKFTHKQKDIMFKTLAIILNNIVEIILFLGIMLICIASFRINTTFGLYVIGASFIKTSLFVLKLSREKLVDKGGDK